MARERYLRMWLNSWTLLYESCGILQHPLPHQAGVALDTVNTLNSAHIMIEMDYEQYIMA